MPPAQLRGGATSSTEKPHLFTELRHLSASHVQELSHILQTQDDWKRVMGAIVRESDPAVKRFTSHHVRWGQGKGKGEGTETGALGIPTARNMHAMRGAVMPDQ